MDIFGGNIKNYIMMKVKVLLMLLFAFCYISCDISKPFVIDGKKEHVLSGECGAIKIKGSSFMSLVIMSFTFDGKYFVDTDSLKIESFFSETEVTNLSFSLNNKKLTSTKIESKEGEILTITFDLINKRKNSMISLLPSNFIKCGDEPIITDTVKVQFFR